MLNFRNHELKAQIEAATGGHPPFALDASSDLAREVRQSIARLKGSPRLGHRTLVSGYILYVGGGELLPVEAAPEREEPSL